MCVDAKAKDTNCLHPTAAAEGRGGLYKAGTEIESAERVLYGKADF